VERAKELIGKGQPAPASSPTLDFFLKAPPGDISIEEHLDKFCMLDDYDLTGTIKNWIFHPDKVLSWLCRSLIDRRLLKVSLRAAPFTDQEIHAHRERVATQLSLTEEETNYFVFTGETTNTTYDPSDERINILFKDMHVRDIAGVDNALIHQTLSSPVKKFYICYLKP
jgi:hypothetical protein